MTESIFELLRNLWGELEQLLTIFSDTFATGSGVGDTVLDYFRYFAYVALVFLSAAFIWNVMEGVLHVGKNRDSKHNTVPWQNIKNIAFIIICASLCSGASTYFKGPKGRTFFGLNYAGVTAPLSQSAMTRALTALTSIDMVENWATALAANDSERKMRMLELLATKDPDLGRIYTNRILYIGGVGDGTGLEWAKTVDRAALAMNVDAATSIMSMAMAGMLAASLLIASLMFIFQAGRTILLLAFYLKLSALLTLVLLPASLGFLYFESMRHWCITIIKHLVVLMLVAGCLANVTVTVFQKSTLQTATTIAMRAELAPYAGKITDADIMDFTIDIDRNALLKQIGGSPETNILGGLTFEQKKQSAIVMMKMMFLLGAMLMLISKLFDIVIGTVDGGWDPFNDGARASGG